MCIDDEKTNLLHRYLDSIGECLRCEADEQKIYDNTVSNNITNAKKYQKKAISLLFQDDDDEVHCDNCRNEKKYCKCIRKGA